MAGSLLASLLSLALWIALVFIRPIGLGIAHLLLALGAVLFIRWWAGREAVNGQG